MAALPTLADFPHTGVVHTRWGDNDIYGHVNNAVYYQYFDSVINRFLIDAGGLDIHHGQVVGFIVRSECDFHAPVSYPGDVQVGLAVERLGRSSVSYGLGLFQGEAVACATARMVHVFVDRATRRPVALPPPLRTALEGLVLPAWDTTGT